MQHSDLGITSHINGENYYSPCGIKATGHGNNKYTNFAIAKHLQAEGCRSPSSSSAAFNISFLVPPCPRTPYTVAIPNQKDELSSSGLPGIGFKSNLKKVVLGQTKRSRAYAPDITFTDTENSVDPGLYCYPECRLRLKYRSQYPEVILGHGTGN